MHHGCHLAVFSVNIVLACHFMTLHPYRNACGIDYASKKLSKMVGNSASYPFNS